MSTPATVTLRPDDQTTTHNGFGGTDWTYTSAGLNDGAADLADNSDGTFWYNGNPHPAGQDLVTFAFNTTALPGSAVITSVTMRVRFKANSAVILSAWDNINGGASRYLGDLNGPVGIGTYSLNNKTTNPSGGAWTQADIDGLRITFQKVSGVGPEIYEVYADVNYNYNAAPGTPTGLSHTSAVTITTPSFQATMPDDGTVKGRFALYQNDGTTLIGTVDSGFVSGGGVASATYGVALPVGTYKVKVKGVDDGGLESAYTGLVAFQINTAVTKEYSTLWNVADPTTPVFKDYSTSWNVAENNGKQLTASWDVYVDVIKDIALRWNVGTAWVDVPAETPTIWTGVTE